MNQRQNKNRLRAATYIATEAEQSLTQTRTQPSDASIDARAVSILPLLMSPARCQSFAAAENIRGNKLDGLASA